MAKREAIRFSKLALRQADEAADLGGSRFTEADSDAEWDHLFEIARKLVFDERDKQFVRFHLQRNRELYLENLLRGTTGYLAFLDVWLVDEAKAKCRARYEKHYQRHVVRPCPWEDWVPLVYATVFTFFVTCMFWAPVVFP
jgi:hypothetical protein